MVSNSTDRSGGSLPAAEGDTLGSLSPVVDIIIPVYRGLKETQNCLASVLAYTQATAMEIVVINDCSPDEAIRGYLGGLAQEHRITLLENPLNLGFVNSVNRGMVLHPERDVILLNSDTEVHGNWLDRLRRCAYSSPQTGTVTPFSNNATICSYPRFIQSNSLPDDGSLQALDELFAEVNSGQAVEIPTAVGFCMYVTRRCLNETGYFDALLFKQGYGEENDFSMRAMELGFRHLLCADVFVYHRGSVSFGSEAEELCAAAQERLRERHPHYFTLVDDFCAQDPVRVLRRRVDSVRLLRSSRERLLLITHILGGGTEKHVQELAKLLEPDFEVLILRPKGLGEVSIEWARSGEEFIGYFPLPYGYPELLEFIKTLGVFYIHFHHTIGLNQQILQLPKDLGVPYNFTLHDYYPICPQYNLTLKNGSYCGEPDMAGCSACLAERPAPWGMDILSWRARFTNILAGAERVIVPSRDMLERMRAYIPEANYVYLPHPEPVIPPPRVTASFINRELKILVLGRLSLAKGLRLLESCAVDAKARQLPLYFRVIGFPDEEVGIEPQELLSFSGPYSDSQLPSLIDRERADIIFFPALWPETYSYTLSYAIRSGLPIAAPRLGAFSERLAGYPWAWLLDWNCSAAEWNDFFVSLLNKEIHSSDRSWNAAFFDPEEYLQYYRQFLPRQGLILAGKDGIESLALLLEKYCYPADYTSESYIETLNRSDLLKLIQNLAPTENHRRIGKTRLLACIQGLRTHIEQLNAKVSEFQTQTAHQKQEINWLQDSTVGRDAEIARLNGELSGLRDTVTGLYSSTSWKITAPLRWVSRVFKRFS